MPAATRDRAPTHAVVLAAGLGSRLSDAVDTPKPLVPVGGVPLLLRVIRSLADAGVRDVHVVVGHRGDEIVRAASTWRASARVHFVENPRWRLKNGVSVLAGREIVQPGSLLSMSDHLFAEELVGRLAAAPYRPGVSLLAVDRRVEDVIDPPDATRVRARGERLLAIGKAIEPHDAIDTGLFRIGPELVGALEAVEQRLGDCSLSEGVAALGERDSMEIVDVSGCAWLDVDTPEALAEAERLVSTGVFG